MHKIRGNARKFKPPIYLIRFIPLFYCVFVKINKYKLKKYDQSHSSTYTDTKGNNKH